jgi:hypothetical protein
MLQCSNAYRNAAIRDYICSEALFGASPMNKKIFAIAAGLVIAGTTATFAAELPAYEANGITVSPVQVRVLGANNVEQQVTAPASSVTALQASVLSPRKLTTATATTRSAR